VQGRKGWFWTDLLGRGVESERLLP
jgi:hypothetical protein